MRAVLRAGNKILTTQGKIFQVGEPRPPVLALDYRGLADAQVDSPLPVWPDSSPSMNNPYQYTATNQPIVRGGGMNGQKYLEFRNEAKQYYNLALGINVLYGTAIMLLRLRSPYIGHYFGFDPTNGFSTPYRNKFLANENFFIANVASNNLTTTYSKYFRFSNQVAATALTVNQEWTLLTIDSVIKPSSHNEFIINRVGWGWDDYYGNPSLNADLHAMHLYDYRLTDVDRKAEEQKILAPYL